MTDLKIQSAPYELREWQPKDIASLLTLQRFYTPHMTEKRLHWAYLDNPSGPARGVLAYTREKLIGCMMAIATSFIVNDQTCRGYILGHFFCHPKFKDPFLFSDMFRLLLDTLNKEQKCPPVLIGFPNMFSVKAVEGYFPKTKLFEYHCYRRPLNLFTKHYDHRLPLMSRLILRLLRPLLICRKYPPAHSSSDSAAIQVEKTDRVTQEHDMFWGRARREYPILISRCRSFIDWRYLRHPDVKHEYYTVKSNSQQIGYFILGSSHKEVTIYDLFLPRNLPIIDAVINIILHIAYRQKVWSVRAIGNPFLQYSMERSGFETYREESFAVVHNPDLPKPLTQLTSDFQSWYLQWGDNYG